MLPGGRYIDWMGIRWGWGSDNILFLDLGVGSMKYRLVKNH